MHAFGKGCLFRSQPRAREQAVSSSCVKNRRAAVHSRRFVRWSEKRDCMWCRKCKQRQSLLQTQVQQKVVKEKPQRRRQGHRHLQFIQSISMLPASALWAVALGLGFALGCCWVLLLDCAPGCAFGCAPVPDPFPSDPPVEVPPVLPPFRPPFGSFLCSCLGFGQRRAFSSSFGRARIARRGWGRVPPGTFAFGYHMFRGPASKASACGGWMLKRALPTFVAPSLRHVVAAKGFRF